MTSKDTAGSLMFRFSYTMAGFQPGALTLPVAQNLSSSFVRSLLVVFRLKSPLRLTLATT
jgi:hypothetical protein